MGQRKQSATTGRKTRPPATLPGLLAEGLSLSAIATQLNVDSETVSKWAAFPSIQRRVAAIEAETDTAAVSALRRLKGVAVSSVAGVLQKDVCGHCGRSKAQDKDLLKAAELVMDRTGLPKTERQEVGGELQLEDTRSEWVLEQEILQESVTILRNRGRYTLANEVEVEARRKQHGS